MTQQEAVEALRLFNERNETGMTMIYKTYSILLLAYVKNFLNDRDQAEDIVAETFSKLWYSDSRFEVMEKLLAYIHVTAKNACIDYLRRKKVEAENIARLESSAEIFFEMNADIRGIEESLQSRIDEEIGKLPKKSQIIFKMAFLEDASNEEIASRLGISEKTVRNRKVAIVKALRSIIGRLWKKR